MLEQGKQVLYMPFGTQVELSPEQFKEIKIGLEKSQVNFLWVVKKSIDEVDDGFKNRVNNRGLMVTEWVDQREILSHRSVEGFLSHYGWNSVVESICTKVPILVWPMMADQHLNARMVVEKIKIGLRIETCAGSVGEITRVIPKTRKKYNDSDKQLVRKNYKAKKLLMCGIGVDQYDLISSCESTKEIWDLLRTIYEGTEETRKSKLDFFTV
ncbi:hypothetical protein H5410_006885 [Solanum commersonii]|uniref:Uncharacterized protein n=1 Tax=Solanum commersonii TaxID=4109 RepID=A0A9J6ABK4_SOLCO|nr:hypothetical protein H5410_006885 [Solanum commersonii]